MVKYLVILTLNLQFLRFQKIDHGTVTAKNKLIVLVNGESDIQMAMQSDWTLFSKTGIRSQIESHKTGMIHRIDGTLSK